ncbi:N-methyl-transferase [Streptomyces clavuligerus]|nr:N-methyl-transferase [Streptomyces clavuligerus]
MVQAHAVGAASLDEFSLLGRDWTQLPEVFAPHLTGSTEFFSTHLPYPVGGSLLEVGSGTGVTAVTAALSGCARVVAVDISPAAVCNSLLNAECHRVSDRVRVLESDLFGALAPDERFDAIFWNSNVIYTPAGFAGSGPGDLHGAVFDPGYVLHGRYLREGPDHLAQGGRLLLGFNSLGDTPRLTDLASGQGLRMNCLASAARHSGGTPVEFRLLEFVPRGEG